MRGMLKKIGIAILAVAVLIGNAAGGTAVARADEASVTLAQKLENEELVIKPGETKHMRLPVKAAGNAILEASAVVTAADSHLTISQASLTMEDQSPALYLSNYGVTYIDFDITAKESTEIGAYPLTVTIYGKVSDASGQSGFTTYPLNSSVIMQVLSELEPAQISISDATIKNAIIGGKTNIVFTFTNEGEMTARNTYYSIDFGETGISPEYGTLRVKAGDIAPGEKKYVNLPVRVLSTATAGLKTLTANFEYKDVDGKEYPGSSFQLYADVRANEDAPDLMIDDLSYTGELKRGSKVTVKAVLRNYGSSRAENVTVKIDDASTGAGAEGFLKDYFTDSIYVGGVKEDKTIEAKIPLKVSENATGGAKALNLIISYADALGKEYTSTIAIYPEVEKPEEEEDEEETISKPKLIISKYGADIDELKAGSIFNFTFDLKNTHTSIAAKNITVTISQADNIFSVTQGSNSFFIERIPAGGTVSQTVEMRVKPDATTKAYPLKLAIEYEYDGIKANPATGEVGEAKEIEVTLQAVENARPVVDNISVYSYNGEVVVGSSATLSFEFYNMGKAPLNNVMVSVEGDFTKVDGDMQYLGNLEAGSSTYNEFDVIPNMEGTSKGVLKVTFEDSNGDKVELTKDFEAPIGAATVFDPGMEGGAIDVLNPEMPVAKEPILPVWLFVIIEVALFAVFVPVTRKVILSIYKAKLRKKEMAE